MVIAAYNAESTLSAALASVAAQSDPPGSVVVVDDGSADRTAEVARGWSDRLPVKVVSHGANMGLAQARRSGIEATTEPLLAILDADDVWLPDHLSLMCSTYTQRPGIITSDALRWMPEAGIGRARFRGPASIPAPQHQRTAILTGNFVFIGVLLSREDYSAAGGFRDGLLGAEDWDLWIRMLRAGVVVTGSTYPTVLYRVHRGGLSWGKQQLENEVRVLDLALREVSRPDEVVAAKRGLRTLHARLSLVQAYDRARAGDSRGARAAALRALAGSRPITLRAAAMIVAPGAGVRLRDRLRWLPGVRLGR